MFESLLTLALIVVVLGVVAWVVLGRRRASGKRSPAGYRRRSPWLKRLPILLAVGAIASLALAFTQFRFLREAGSAGTVVLVMDVSESMNRTDVQPTRLDAAEAAARVFLDRLPSDLNVGLVTFAGEAEVVVPPTTQRSAVVAALAALPRGEGTVIGDGLSASLDAIEAEREPAEDAPAAVVLLSDGRDTGSQVPPEEAASRSSDLEIPVHTVVLGQAESIGAGGANVTLLERIADSTGGSSFTADTAGGLVRVYETLEAQISTELGISDYGALFVGIAAVLAIAATILVLLALRSEY